MRRGRSVRRVCRRTVVVVLVLAAVATVATPAAAHEIVTFGDRPFEAAADGELVVPVEFHRTETATFRIENVVAVGLVDTDGDDRVRVRLDLAVLSRDPAAAVTVENGEARRVRANESATVTSGNYTLRVAPAAGIGDRTFLLVTDSDGTGPATNGTAEASPTTDPSEADGQTTAGPAGAVAAASDDESATTGSNAPVFVAALFGPAVLVGVLVLGSRLYG